VLLNQSGIDYTGLVIDVPIAEVATLKPCHSPGSLSG